MATNMRFVSDEELSRTPNDGVNYERVDGELRGSPGGALHSAVSVGLAVALGTFVKRHRLGHVVGTHTGYRWPGRYPDRPDNVRCPDLSFVAAGRFPDEDLPAGWPDLAPDLAVEVLSPFDRARDVFEKVGEYFDAGSRLVWVIDPTKRTAAVYRGLTDARTLRENDALDGEDVVPGFACPLKDVLDR